MNGLQKTHMPGNGFVFNFLPEFFDFNGLLDTTGRIATQNPAQIPELIEGGYLYMRQKKMTPELEEVEVDILSSKGAQDVGLHVFSTSGLLDGSWYNRAFWMYSKRWPGFQLANQAPKTGQDALAYPAGQVADEGPRYSDYTAGCTLFGR